MNYQGPPPIDTLLASPIHCMLKAFFVSISILKQKDISNLFTESDLSLLLKLKKAAVNMAGMVKKTMAIMRLSVPKLRIVKLTVL